MAFGMNRMKQKQQMQNNLANAGLQVEKENLSQLKIQMESFSKNLENFAVKYKSEIKFNPEFREKFYTMCQEIGVDPLASSSLWNKELNLNEFYYNLAIQIMTIAIALRDQKGALLEVDELKKILLIKRKSNDLSEYLNIYILLWFIMFFSEQNKLSFYFPNFFNIKFFVYN